MVAFVSKPARPVRSGVAGAAADSTSEGRAESFPEDAHTILLRYLKERWDVVTSLWKGPCETKYLCVADRAILTQNLQLALDLSGMY